MTINNETPIAMLTVGQLKEVLNLVEQPEKVVKIDTTTKQYVYGLKGIREVFQVSHATAQKYKDGILKKAVTQYGRKIILDVDMARMLFKENGGSR